ncbi:MAG TPA: SHOCT domain-containing protein [Thermoplasmata archaeon]|nr:SHOCT domain-containing protein [Thermoplasmata archaeon]
MYPPYTGEAPRRPIWPWILLGGVVITIVLLVVYLLYLGPFSGTGPGGRPYYPFFGGFFLIFLLVWVGFFALRMALWRGYRSRYPAGHGQGPGPGGRRRDPAIMVARQRYARGEITREQYDQIVTDLTRHRNGP